jgi:predicted ATPase
LDSDEKALFARLGIFVGGCMLESAHAVCGDGLTLDVTVGVESLLNKSLLQQEAVADGGMRFMMLETMREYALEKLAERGEVEETRQRHAQYFMALMERAKGDIYSANQVYWLAWFDAEHDNLRAALRWCWKPTAVPRPGYI